MSDEVEAGWFAAGLVRERGQAPLPNPETFNLESFNRSSCSALSTQYSALSTQYSALSTQHSALSTQYSVLIALCSVLISLCPTRI
jgi:hypothetical protein